MNNDEFWQYAGKKAAESKGCGLVVLALLIAMATLMVITGYYEGE